MVKEQYITAIKNRETGQFTRDIQQLFTYRVNYYENISPSQLSNFEREVTELY